MPARIAYSEARAQLASLLDEAINNRKIIIIQRWGALKSLIEY